MRKLFVTVGVLGTLGLCGGCYVHERAPRYGYGYGYEPARGPHRDWRADERHEGHEEHEEHEHHEWR